jgi:hypothetical protein
MSGKESGSTLSRRRLLWVGAGVTAAVVAETAMENLVVKTIFREEQPVRPELPNQTFLKDVANKYTTAGPAIDRELKGQTPEEIEESVNTHPISNGDNINGTRYSLDIPQFEKGKYTHSLTLIVVSSESNSDTQTEKIVISAFLGVDGIELRYRPDNRHVSPEELQRRAGEFIKVPGISDEDGWEPLPPRGPNKPDESIGIEKAVPLDDGQKMTVRMTRVGRVDVEIVKPIK